MREYTPAARLVALVLSLAVLHPRGALAQVNVSSSGGTFSGGDVTGATTFLDGTNFSINNTADPTKQIRFSAASITTGTARTYTMPNVSSTVCVAGADCNFSVAQTVPVAGPAIAASGASTTGFGFASSGNVGLYQAGVLTLNSTGTGTEGARVPSGYYIGWSSSGTNGAAMDTFLGREGAAIVQHGVDVNGAAVNQTIKAHDGITGSDVKGASLIVEPGLGTGNAVSNPLTLNRVMTKATGTTAQTYSPAYIVCPSKILSNTSATAQTIATITTTSTTAGSITMDYAVTANNGTLQDQDSGMVKVSWNNNAGTVAAAMTAVALQSDSDASGTLATTPTATVATNVVSVKFTPTWVTIVPTTVTGYATFTIHSAGDTVVCQ